jgi:hypothetical protein
MRDNPRDFVPRKERAAFARRDQILRAPKKKAPGDDRANQDTAEISF